MKKKSVLIVALLLCLVIIGGCCTVNDVETSGYSDVESKETQSDAMKEQSNESVNPLYADFQPPESLNPKDFAVRLIENQELYDGTISKSRFLQIFYGYYIGSKATYIPCEELELYSVLNKNGDSGYYAAGDSHTVLIGDCIVIALAVHDASDYDEIVVKDTLNSYLIEVKDRFTHYDVNKVDSQAEKYGYCKQDSGNKSENGKFLFARFEGFPEWYYVVLKADSITEDYELTLTKTKQVDDSQEETDVFKLTYQDLKDIYAHKEVIK